MDIGRKSLNLVVPYMSSLIMVLVTLKQSMVEPIVLIVTMGIIILHASQGYIYAWKIRQHDKFCSALIDIRLNLSKCAMNSFNLLQSDLFNSVYGYI